MFWLVGVVVTIMVWILICRFFCSASFIEETIEAVKAENHDVEGAKSQVGFRNANQYICASSTSYELETKAVTI